MRRFFDIGLIGLLVVSTGTACSSATKARAEEQSFRGVVLFATDQGGCWALERSDGRRFEAIRMPAEFRQAGLEIRATVRLRPDVSAKCLPGQMVDVISIERIR